ncbi:putative Limkain-b1 [Cocos nucifera]|uniref:Putative Limkain-b1 n=1 Tax=Cocos nucifera TaxID=13894 RepID=A0A8K0ND84_COCNU|nr:putative Limkain-b1 [Cocos nucifera]
MVGLRELQHPGGKNSSDRSFMSDLVYWVSQNPPPVHFFLISGDRDFANILHRLRMSNYNILLASTDTAPGVLCSAATIMWPWSALVKGENISVKHFNHPPDGLYGSWYGHHKGVLDDPFSGMEQAANSQPDEYMESVSEAKPRPIPKAVVNGIRQVLSWYPEGINLSDLRIELKRNNIPIDKDFFGHKKFSHLLCSMPNVVRFIPPAPGENQPVAIGTQRRVSESVEPSPKLAKDIEISDGKGHAISRNGKTSELSPPTTISEPSPNQKETDANARIGTSTVPQGHEGVVEGRFERLWKISIGSEPSNAEPSPSSKGTDVNTFVGASTSQQQNAALVEEGLFRRIWKTLSGSRGGHSKDKNGTMHGADSATREDSNEDVASVCSCKHSEKPKSEEKKAARPKNDPSGLMGCGLSSSDASKSHAMDKTVEPLEEHIGAADMRMGFFSWMASWWRSWKYGAKGQEDSVASIREVLDNEERIVQSESVKTLTDDSCRPEAHDLFSKVYFWDALESFLLASKGSDIILKSRTRGQLVQNLQKEGPWVLKDLKENHLLQLVDLLISDKKWVEESASQTFPFKVTFPAKRRCVPSDAHGSNGLSSLFSGRMSQSSLQSLPEQEKQAQISRPLGSSYNESVDSKPPQNFSELKAWFQKTFNATEGVEPEDFKRLFESTFDRRLFCSSYGYLTVQSLIAACSADNVSNQGIKKRPPSREEVLSDCHRVLKELLEEYPDGFNMSIIRPTFIQRYGYVLDYQMLGYPKFVSLLQIMPGVRIESPYILPAEKLSDSSLEKQAIGETPFDSLEGDKGKVISKENEGKYGEEHVWEELGPVSDTVIHEGGNLTEEMDKQVSFDEASLSDEEFTDTEDDTPRHFGESEGKSRKSDEESSLLQILDSWYSSKEAGEKDQAQAVDGLVDCSRSNAENPVDLKSRDSQLKVRPPKRYSFVSESRDDEKEKLVKSILGSLKKAGDSRLQS